MATIPFLTEAVADGIIRALRFSGVITDDASAQTLRELHNGLTEAEMDAIVSGLNFGANIGGNISSVDDLFAFVDSDALPAPKQDHTNFFRVVRWQEEPPLQDPDNAMLTVYWPSTELRDISAVIGPDTNILTTYGTDDTWYTAKLYMGGGKPVGLNAYNFAKLEAGPDAAIGDIPGVRLQCGSPATTMDFASMYWMRFWSFGETLHSGNDPSFIFPPLAPVSLGGFTYANTKPQLYVGDYGGLSGTDAFLVQPDAIDGDYQLRINYDTNPRGLYMRNSRSDWTFRLLLNGGDGTFERTIGYYSNPIFTVLGTDQSAGVDSIIAYFRDKKTSYSAPSGQHLVQVWSDVDRNLGNYNLLTCYTHDGVLVTPVFRVSSSGECFSGTQFTNGGADLAEWVTVAEDYEKGSVLMVNDGGEYVPTDESGTTKVVGVVSTQPAVAMNYREYEDTENTIDLSTKIGDGDMEEVLTPGEHDISGWITIGGEGYEVEESAYDSEKDRTRIKLKGVNKDKKIHVQRNVRVKANVVKLEHRVLLGICGLIPTKCTTSAGDISPGDLLVASTDGHAEKAPNKPEAGTIVGKAMEALAGEPGETATGKITVLVTLQ